jgi:phosphoserine aminotransferase
MKVTLMKRIHNFNAGPAAFPLSVLARAKEEFIDYQGEGLSVLEMSHREATFESILARAKSAITKLYQIPDTHEVLFLQGGASLQFAMIPMNLGEGGAYLNTGVWATNALSEAKILGQAYELWSSQKEGFNAVPQTPIHIDQNLQYLQYLHYTSNNTIYGTQYHHIPSLIKDQTKYQPMLVCDMSSDFLSRPVDISAYDLIYAGAQKNAGPAGVTVVIIKKTISRQSAKMPNIPKILQYKTHADKDSMFNTPNTYGIYLLMLMCEWMIEQGGVEHLAQINAQKSKCLYDLIDLYPNTFEGHALKHSRSMMNVTFRLKDESRLDELMQACEAKDIIGIKGHRSVGGMRVSLYNAVTLSSVYLLVDVLETFAKSHSSKS